MAKSTIWIIFNNNNKLYKAVLQSVKSEFSTGFPVESVEKSRFQLYFTDFSVEKSVENVENGLFKGKSWGVEWGKN